VYIMSRKSRSPHTRKPCGHFWSKDHKKTNLFLHPHSLPNVFQTKICSFPEKKPRPLHYGCQKHMATSQAEGSQRTATYDIECFNKLRLKVSGQQFRFSQPARWTHRERNGGLKENDKQTLSSSLSKTTSSRLPAPSARNERNDELCHTSGHLAVQLLVLHLWRWLTTAVYLHIMRTTSGRQVSGTTNFLSHHHLSKMEYYSRGHGLVPSSVAAVGEKKENRRRTERKTSEETGR
jgi:hypothetical protein